MTNQLAKQLRKVTIGDDVQTVQDEVMNYLFEGLNEKLNPIGLNISQARLGFRKDVDVNEIFASLKAAEIV